MLRDTTSKGGLEWIMGPKSGPSPPLLLLSASPHQQAGGHHPAPSPGVGWIVISVVTELLPVSDIWKSPQ